MKKLVSLLLAITAYFYISAQTEKPYVHCIVLDKTMSMIGKGGTDIWNDVQNYCYDWVDGVPQTSTIVFFTYDRDLYGPQVFVINSDNDKKNVKEAIKNVVVDGKFTYIASNLGKAVNYVYNNFPDNNKRIYLITDGIEEEQGSDFAGVLHNYGSWRGDYDYLYYVDLNNKATDEIKREIDNTDGAVINPGFVEHMTMSPVMSRVNYILGTSSFEQDFVVTGGKFIPGMTYNVKVDSVINCSGDGKVINVRINPYEDIQVDSINYFNLFFLNNSENECNVYVSLHGIPNENTELTFAPDNFCIHVRNKTKGRIILKEDENGKKGWNVIKVE